MIYDIAIIGGGPAGYTAAVTASENGAKTILFEKKHMGGICVNYGCIPTKAILKSAISYRNLNEKKITGIKTENTFFNLSEIVANAQKTAEKLKNGINFLLNKNKVEIVNAEAKIYSAGKIEADGKIFECKNIIITTGQRPKEILELPINDIDIITYKTALFPTEIPENLTIIGSGAIGMEFAEIYSDFGSKITIIEKEKQIIPYADKDISDLMKRILTKRGYTFYTDTTITSYQKENGKIILNTSSNEKISCDKVLVAAGVSANTENLGLEENGIETVNGFIKTDKFATNIEGIYAVGDVAGPPYLAHKAMHDAKNCVKMILGKEYTYTDRNLIPSCIYTSPQIAFFGRKTEKSFKQLLMTNGKAVCDNATEGFIKTYTDENGKIAGASLIGENVSEIIGSYLAMAADKTENIIMPHPTISESVIDSINNALSL